jgi:hypothetical protein
MALLATNFLGALDRLYRSTTISFFLSVLSTVEILSSSGSTPTPHNPVEQHIAGSNICIIFII